MIEKKVIYTQNFISEVFIMTDETINKLQRLGLAEAKAKETVKNKNLTKNLLECLEWAGQDTELSGVRGNLLYHVAR